MGCRDITWGYARNVAGDKKAMAAVSVIEKYMLHTLYRVDLVIGVSYGITGKLVEGGLNAEKTITVSNGISSDLMEEIMRRTADNVQKRRPIVAYAGLIGYNQRLSVLVEATSSLPEVDLILVG